MGCEYSHDAGYNKAINKFHKRINELLEEATKTKPTELPPQEYWRHVGKQDILLGLLNDLCNMIDSKER